MHPCRETQHTMDHEGGLQALLLLLDDPRSSPETYEQALCAVFNLLRDKPSRCVDLVKQPLVYQVLIRQLKAPMQGGTDNCRYLTASVIRCLVSQPNLDENVCRALKHPAMAQVLEALQQALQFNGETKHIGFLRAPGGMHSRHVSFASATPAASTALVPQGSMHRRAASAAAPTTDTTSTTTAATTSSGTAGPAALTAPKAGPVEPAPAPTFFNSNEQMLEMVVAALHGLCLISCRPPRGHLPQLAQATAQRLVQLLASHDAALVSSTIQMLCLMSVSEHARRQMLAADAAPSLLMMLEIPRSRWGPQTLPGVSTTQPGLAPSTARPAAFAAKAIRNLAVSQPLALLKHPWSVSRLLEALSLKHLVGLPEDMLRASMAVRASMGMGMGVDGMGGKGMNGLLSAQPSQTSVFDEGVVAGQGLPLLHVGQDVYQQEIQKQALAALISMTRTHGEGTCHAVISAAGHFIIAEVRQGWGLCTCMQRMAYS